MTDLQILTKNGRGTVWRVGFSMAIVISIFTGGMFIGSAAQDVESLQEAMSESKAERVRIEKELKTLHQARAASGATAVATEYRLQQIETTIKENGNTLGRIEGLLEGMGSNRIPAR